MEKSIAFSQEPESIKIGEKEKSNQDNYPKTKELGLDRLGLLEYKESYIDFPEYLIKETGGVKGYIRKEVEYGELSRFLNSIIDFDKLNDAIYLHNEFALGKNDISDKIHDNVQNITDIDSLKKFEYAIFKLNKVFQNEKDFYNKENQRFKEKVGEDVFREYERCIEKSCSVIDKIINGLGNNFLDKTNLHQMGGVWNLSAKDSEKFKEGIVKQRIFSPDLDSVTSNNREYNIGFNLVSTDTGKIIEKKDEEEIIPKELIPVFFDEKRKIKNADDITRSLREKHIAEVPQRGLSVMNVDKGGVNSSHVYWGFSGKNLAYKNYLESSRKFLKKIESNRFSDKYYQQWDKKAGFGQPEIRDYKAFVDDLLSGDVPNLFAHPYIPIIIGHPDIPDLRWCHASYAYIPTKNGISVLEFVT